jgi:capsid protein
MAVFAQMDATAFQEIFNQEQQEMYINTVNEVRKGVQPWQFGRVLNTMPGETITTPTPGRPNPNFDGFVQPFFTLLGMGLNLPPEVMTGLFKSSYTAARAAAQQLWQMIYVDRMGDIAQTCQPVYETWMDDCVMDGLLEAPGYFADPFIRYAWQGSEWTGSGPASLNPKQEAEAAQIRALFLTDEQTETNAYDGGDSAARHAQRAREAAARRRDGLPPLGGQGAAAPAPAPGGQPPQPSQPDEEDNSDDDTMDSVDQ